MSVPSGLRGPEVPKSQLYADRLEDRPGMVQKPLDLGHGLSAISMEERNVLLSLERLDQLLQCEHLHYADGCSKKSHFWAELADYVVIFCIDIYVVLMTNKDSLTVLGVRTQTGGHVQISSPLVNIFIFNY